MRIVRKYRLDADFKTHHIRHNMNGASSLNRYHCYFIHKYLNF